MYYNKESFDKDKNNVVTVGAKIHEYEKLFQYIDNYYYNNKIFLKMQKRINK